MKFLSVLFVFISVVASSKIPEPLEQWQQWVQYEQEYRNCPHYQNQPVGSKTSHVCAWPEILDININDKQADFSINWDVIDDSWVDLPGDRESWPQAVTANNQSIAVTSVAGKPRIYLSKGKYSIQGKFSWSTRPETIKIPAEIAEINLYLDEKPVLFPERKKSSLWLGESASSSKEESNNVELVVNRLIIDGHPMTMYITLEIYASGVARNEKLGKIGSEILQISNLKGDISAYVDSDGYLWAQLKPGTWELNISFNILGWPEQIPFQRVGENWPKQEVWAYQDNKNIRFTQISGVTAINPEQTSSPWDQVPNYLLNDGDVLNIKEQKRGTLNQSEQLRLYRQLWLSFDGNSYRSKDKIVGEKLGSWRLNAQQDYQLLNATSHQETLLITKSAQKEQGLELRTPSIDLQVSGEFKAGLPKSISAWKISFDSIKTDLFLPYGYMAFATNNVDKSSNVWMEKWALWDIFVVMLLVAFTYKIIGLKASLFAFLALVLGYHEPEMPVVAWANVIFAIALFAFKPSGKFYTMIRSYLYVSLLGLIVVLIPFLISQVRLSIHPQLENKSVSTSISSFSKAKKPTLNKLYTQTYSTSNAVQMDAEEAVFLERVVTTGSNIKNSDLLNRYQSDAILQAGKGTPQWRFNQVSLQWDGPITAEQSYSLFLLTPILRIIWRLALVFTAVLWLLLLVNKMREKTKPIQQKLAASIIFTLMVVLLPSSLFAQNFPSNEMLQQLQTRIYNQPNCSLNCASIESAIVNASGNQLTIKLVYHAFSDSAVAIPDSDGWRINSIKLNNKLVQKRIKYRNQTWIAVEKGVNTIILAGVLANSNNITVLFPLPPGIILTTADNWQFAGVDGQKLTNNTLQLIAMARDSESTEQSKTTEIKQFVRIKRRLTFDDNWYLNTNIERIAPLHGAINLSVPLIANEHPNSNLQLQDGGQVMVSLGPNQLKTSWQSTLDRTENIELVAANDANYLEVWEILSAPQWHVEISGIPIVAPDNFVNDMDDYFIHIYMPRPGEKLSLKLSRPEAVSGEILSIESVYNEFSVGKRSSKVVSVINYRATQGGDFQVQLDEDVTIKKVSYDGVDSNLLNENGLVTVSFLPGNHKVEIEWHINKPITIFNKTPSIKLGKEFSNLTQKIKVPRDRWLLWGKSAGVGPAFLYWGELLVFIILAFFMARAKYAPLKFWQWLVLGFAFGTFSWLAFAWIAAWLFFIGWKKQFKGFETTGKNISLQWLSLAFTGITILILIIAVANGLLSYPNMGVAGQGASATQLRWFLDIGQNQLPSISLLSVPLWWYKGLILIWSIWISFSLINWLKQLFEGFERTHWWPKSKVKPKKN